MQVKKWEIEYLKRIEAIIKRYLNGKFTLGTQQSSIHLLKSIRFPLQLLFHISSDTLEKIFVELLFCFAFLHVWNMEAMQYTDVRDAENAFNPWRLLSVFLVKYA